ncbi:MAG: glycosyltransferase family 4 protein [Acidobacteria bacterium]|nr:glycosyltransferase family 4 protein [Acidobacteriota bacterium]
MRVLLVTNDFPPRVGGIQSYLWSIYRGLARSGVEVSVLAPAHPGAEAFDAAAEIEILRWPGSVYWPTPRLEQRVRRLARRAGVVAFGAVLPMSLIGAKVEAPVVVHTHGFEVAWARLPGLRSLLARIARSARAVTVVSDFTRRFVEPVVPAGTAVEMLRTGVDLERFAPTAAGEDLRRRCGLAGRPVVACVSRLVPRKGQDMLVRAMPAIRRAVPDAAALMVGGGPIRARLERLARERGVAGSVVFTGELPEDDLAAAYAAGDVFAMPCRSRWGGLEVEGLGLVYLEAQACARPAITGDSGGAPEAVVPGKTGLVVPGRDPRALARAVARMLGSPEEARLMGEAGRRFVERDHRWEDVVARCRAILERAAR